VISGLGAQGYLLALDYAIQTIADWSSTLKQTHAILGA
jgi:hypothetical protein